MIHDTQLDKLSYPISKFNGATCMWLIIVSILDIYQQKMKKKQHIHLHIVITIVT